MQMPAINWEDIYRLQAPRMLGLCRRYVRDLQTAEDLMHDAFFTAIREQQHFTGRGNVEAWLRKITLNTALSYLRQEKKLVELAQADLPEYPEEAMQEEDADSPEQVLHAAGFEKADLIAVLDLLPEHHRVAFNLYVFEAYTHKQIGAELGISPGTSKSHLARARKKIQELLLAKAKNMHQKPKRAALFLLFAGWEKKNHLDSLYQSSLSDFDLLPSGAPPTALVQAFRKAPPVPTATVFATSFKIVAGMVLIITAGVSLFVYSANVIEKEQPVLSTSENTNAMTISIDSVENARVTPSVFQKPAQSTAAPRENLVYKKPQPVVVHKTITLRDTIYEFIPSAHEE